MHMLINMGFLAVLMLPSPVLAQVNKVTGSQDFCLVVGSKADCKFDTAKGCEIEISGTNADSHLCIERTKINQWPANRYAR